MPVESERIEAASCLFCGGAQNRRLVRCLDKYICHACTLSSIERLVTGEKKLESKEQKCAFCGQVPHGTVRLVGNTQNQVCSDCLKLAVAILVDEPQNEIRSLEL